jgi:hypothetical protein
MDRRVIRRLLSSAGLALAAALMLTCSNPISFKDAVETEVKIANNKFLIVQSVTPALNATDVNPGLSLTIVFDRELDESTIADGILALSPAASEYDYTYTAATKTLAIHALPYLADATAYTASLTKNLRGADGSELQNEYVWGFTTGTYPAGSVHINNDDLATNIAGITMHFDWNPVVDKYRYSLVSEADLAGKSWLSLPAVDVDDTLSGPDGAKTVWVQYRDDGPPAAESLVQADEIFYDTTPPAVNYVRINKDSVYTTSTSVTLYNSVSDLTPMQMRFQNVGGAWSEWQTYASSRAWTLKNSVGTLVVNAEYRDSAGNAVSPASDAVIYGVVTANYASKGAAAAGSVAVYFDAPLSEAATPNRYYIYRRDYPSGDRYTSLGYVTASGQTVAAPEETFYWFHVRIWNETAGGYGLYGTTGAMGYTANITIIYDSNDGTDTSLANSLKSVLQTDWPNHATYGADIDGTMPSWSVMLIPQSMISTTYSAANWYGGDPVIITHGNDLYANASQTRNVTAYGRGVVGMGTGGAQLLGTVAANWAAWGFGGTSPSEITYGAGAGLGQTYYVNTWTMGNTTWSSPLASNGVPGISLPGDTTPNHDALVQMAYGNVYRRGINRGAAPTNPTDGVLLAKDDTYGLYFPIVRQGRFLHYGFYALPARPYTGYVNLVNLIALMDNY